MYGLESIRAINAHAVQLREDEARRARGLKPKTAIGAANRKAKSANSPQRRPGFGIRLQGREVTIK